MSERPHDAELDGCDVDMTDPEHLTGDGEDDLALILFADCWDDPDAVAQRRADLVELDAADA